MLLRGETPIEGAGEALGRMRDAGKKILLLTNNAAYSAVSIAELVAGTGVEADPTEVLTSAMVLRDVIAREHPGNPEAFVLGPSNLAETLAEIVRIVPISPEASPGLVAVGRETGFDYAMLDAASKAVRAGAELFACNRDATMPVEGGFEPGTGAIVAAIEVASGVQARAVGKPNIEMMDAARGRLGDGRILLIGDRPESDIAGARRAGFDAALVLTGVANEAPVGDLAPDHVLGSIAELS